MHMHAKINSTEKKEKKGEGEGNSWPRPRRRRSTEMEAAKGTMAYRSACGEDQDAVVVRRRSMSTKGCRRGGVAHP